MPSSASWNPSRAKIQLKLSIQRLRLLSAKKTQLAKATRREIASLLEKGRIETSRIKVEATMGEDNMIELLEVLELYCELLLARFGLLEAVPDIDPGVAEAVNGVVHAAPRTELKELHILRDMLISKAGRDFAISAIDNVDNCVSERITSKLVIAQPPADLVDLYLYEIAKAYSVDWRPDSIPDPNAVAEEPSSSAVPTAMAVPVPSTPTKAVGPNGVANGVASHALSPFDTASGFPQTPPVDPKQADHVVIVRTSLPSPGLTAPSAPPAATTTATAPAAPAAATAPTPGPTSQSIGFGNAAASAKKQEEDAFEALSRRFAELKKR